MGKKDEKFTLIYEGNLLVENVGKTELVRTLFLSGKVPCAYDADIFKETSEGRCRVTLAKLLLV